jgi:lipoate-protein ligase A
VLRGRDRPRSSRAESDHGAQRRTPLGILQHGSIRIADDTALYRALTGASPAPRPPPGLDPELLRDALVRSFEIALGTPLEPAVLSPAERARAEARMAQRASTASSRRAFL